MNLFPRFITKQKKKWGNNISLDDLSSVKNEVTFDEAQTAIKALGSFTSSGLVEPYIVRKLEAVIASLKAASFNKTAISVVSE